MVRIRIPFMDLMDNNLENRPVGRQKHSCENNTERDFWVSREREHNKLQLDCGLSSIV